MGRNITIYDIAKEAGLSHTTVSQALRNFSCVKEETRQRVLEIAHRMGYNRNFFAASLRKGSSRQIALVIPRNDNRGKMANLFDALQRMLYQNGYSLILFPLLTPENTKQVFEQVLQGGYDGVITYLYTYEQFRPYAAAFRERHCPVVVIGSPSDMECRPGIIVFDQGNLASLQEALQTLHELGHRRIVHIQDPRHAQTPQCRLIHDFVQEHGPARWQSELLVETGGQPGLEAGRCTAARLLAERPGVTAVQCPNDYFAAGLICGLHDHGVEVPRDISVIGSDNQDLCEYLIPRLSSIEIGDYNAAPQMVASLLEHLRETEWESLANCFELNSVFHRRESIGPARV